MISYFHMFKNNEFGQIGVIEFNKEIWFVAQEVTTILGYSNTKDALKKYVLEVDKNTVAIYDGIQNRNQLIINNRGVSSLILASKLAGAEKFKTWISSEVLGSINETAAEFRISTVGCKEGILIRDYAKILTNSYIKIGQAKLFSWLHSRGYIYRDKGLDQWMAHKKYVEMEIFKVSETKISTSKYGNKISVTIKITDKGQKHFYEELKTQYLLN